MNHRRSRILALSAGVLAGMSLIGYLIYSDYRQAVEAAQARTRDYAAILQTRLDATLRRADADLVDLARDLPIAALRKQQVALSGPKFNAQLDARMVNFPELAGYRVFDAAGDQLYSSDRANTPFGKVGDRDYFLRLRDDPQAGLVFSEVNTSRTTGRATLVAGRAVRDRQGAFRGIVIASVELAYFQKLFQALALGSRSIVSVYRSDDFKLVVRWPTGSVKLNTPLPSNTPARTLLAPGKKTATATFPSSNDGIVRTYSFHALDRYPFYVVVGVAREETLAGWRARALGVGLSLVLLAGLLIRLLVRLWRTEVKQEQSLDALAQSEDRFRKLFDRASDGIMIMSSTGSLIAVNESFAQMHGYTTQEMQTLNLKALDTPETSQRLPERMKRLFSKQFVTFEVDHYHKDGHVFPLEVSASLIVSAGETLIQSFHRDITERKLADEALKQSEERYRTVANFTYDWEYWVLPDGSLPYISPSCEHISGYRAQEFMEDSSLLTRIVHPEDRAQVEAHLQAVQTPETDPEHHELDFRIITRQGEERWIAHACQHIYGENGKHLGRRASNRDITGRKQVEAERAELEAQLQESQKMEALGTLAGGVAHDFNNALASILGNVELARQDVGPGHEALVSLEEIGKASRRATDLVQQILTFGRRAKLERKPTSLALVVVESARLLRATLPAKVVLNVDCKGDTPAVLADAAQVKQILLNLCGNALQAVQDQERPGVIEVRLETHMQAEARGNLRPGRYACLTVRDNGPGMDEETRSHVFEPFFTTKQKGKGTGLGLSVVHGIAQSHQASIEVESSPGEGSTFRIYFPAIDALVAEVPASTADTAPADGRGLHVLYVDDEQAIVFLMKRLLERQGYRVSGFTQPQEALATVRANPDRFDLAVTDYNMPGMSGLEVAQALREIRPDLPVVLASGYITEELRAQAPVAGIRELIYKPNTVDDLCEAVARAAQTAGGQSRPS